MAFGIRPFFDGLRRLLSRRILPTSMGSREIGLKLDGEVKRAAMFSARVEHARVLQRLRDVVGEIVLGVTPEMPGTAPTIIDYDDSVKVLGTALSYARHLMNGATSHGRLSLTTNAVDGYAFENSSGSFAVVWLNSITDTPRQLAITGSVTNGLQIVDISGYLRSDSADTVPAGIVPVYVITTNAVADIVAALESATISDYADASAPNISVVSVDEISDTATLRWLAIDDESFPNDSNETAIEYSYRINGGSWSDWTPYTTEDFAVSTTGRVDIRARDEAGNIGDVTWLGELLPSSATANIVNVGTLNIGQ